MNDEVWKYFVKVGLWQRQTKFDPRGWMSNFDDAEKPFAARLLEGFTYFSNDLVTAMFRAAFKNLSQVVLKQPMGDWFLTVAAGLEYMYNKPDGLSAEAIDEEDGDSADGQDDASRDEGRIADANGRASGGDDAADPAGGSDGDDERDARAREEAGADWLAGQGFDRKD